MATKNAKEIALEQLAPKSLDEFKDAAALEASIQELVRAETATISADAGNKEDRIIAARQGLETLTGAAGDILAAFQAGNAKGVEEACLRMASAIQFVENALA